MATIEKKTTVSAPAPPEPKRPVGRPGGDLLDSTSKRVQIYISDDGRREAWRLGKGNMSEGVRQALARTDDHKRLDDLVSLLQLMIDEKWPFSLLQLEAAILTARRPVGWTRPI